MATLDLLLKALDSAHWELSEAFQAFPDEDLWKRPYPQLLSVGELAAHIAYGEASSFLGDHFESPLVSAVASYYTSNVQTPYSLDLSAEQVLQEVKRVHEVCRSWFISNPRDSEEQSPYREGWTWGYVLEYQTFHVAYHTGQIYSVRHLLGHETVDN